MRKTIIIFFSLMFFIFSGLLLSQSFTLITPNGGESWCIGKTYEIKWNSSQVQGNIILKLQKGNTLLGSIAWNIPNTGTYSWTINDIQGIPIEPGNDYRVIVRSKDDHYIEDISNANFTINPEPCPGGISLEKPNGGESWNIGDTYDIKWNSNQVQVNIILKLKKGNTLLGSIAWNIPNTGTYSWTIDDIAGTPIQPGNDYKVMVRSFENHIIEDESNGVFEIKNASINKGYILDKTKLGSTDLYKGLIRKFKTITLNLNYMFYGTGIRKKDGRTKFFFGEGNYGPIERPLTNLMGPILDGEQMVEIENLLEPDKDTYLQYLPYFTGIYSTGATKTYFEPNNNQLIIETKIKNTLRGHYIIYENGNEIDRNLAIGERIELMKYFFDLKVDKKAGAIELLINDIKLEFVNGITNLGDEWKDAKDRIKNAIINRLKGGSAKNYAKNLITRAIYDELGQHKLIQDFKLINENTIKIFYKEI